MIKKTTYIACVKNKITKENAQIQFGDYPSKAAFAKDLRLNGFQIKFITTEEKFDEDCEKYNERLVKMRRYAQIQRESKKRIAKVEEEAEKTMQVEEIPETHIDDSRDSSAEKSIKSFVCSEVLKRNFYNGQKNKRLPAPSNFLLTPRPPPQKQPYQMSGKEVKKCQCLKQSGFIEPSTACLRRTWQKKFVATART